MHTGLPDTLVLPLGQRLQNLANGNWRSHMHQQRHTGYPQHKCHQCGLHRLNKDGNQACPTDGSYPHQHPVCVQLLL